MPSPAEGEGVRGQGEGALVGEALEGAPVKRMVGTVVGATLAGVGAFVGDGVEGAPVNRKVGELVGELVAVGASVGAIVGAAMHVPASQ